MTRRSESSLRGSRKTASPRRTRCSSSPPTRTITSSAAARPRQTAMAFTRLAPTPTSARSTPRSTVYITGNPAPTDAVTRTLEHDVAALTVPNPITGNDDKLSDLLADRAEMKLLHMVPFPADRVPTFTMFANDNYFISVASNAGGHGKDCSQAPACTSEETGFAWNHGDFQQDITRTWFGMAGPGVAKQGRFDGVFSDHTDLRPTVMALLGLKDDYVHDGRVLVENLEPHVLPDSLRDSLFT